MPRVSSRATRRPRSPLRRGRDLVTAVAAAGALALGVGAAPAAATGGSVTPVPSLDLQRYLGEWHQVAAIPQWFEALCVSNSLANYSLYADGSVRVSNRCIGPFGASVTARGRARVLDTTTNAQLQVSFVALPGNNWFYPNATPNYVVIALGAAYDYAVVASPERSSAFVLSRAPALTADQWVTVKAALRDAGFDPCKVKITRTRGGLNSTASICTI